MDTHLPSHWTVIFYQINSNPKSRNILSKDADTCRFSLPLLSAYRFDTVKFTILIKVCRVTIYVMK